MQHKTLWKLNGSLKFIWEPGFGEDTLQTYDEQKKNMDMMDSKYEFEVEQIAERICTCSIQQSN